ncbi:unnamed protein product [Caenorhabditis bovis]|uniref:Structural maintenance of chromosomes protein 5 n=1 Tax=Caenorhabditis bovis TaxID=2654633 RepID=A0A8S1FCR4_9PELO|nr:unnamed protein product [Caenorhabditis bovis]
MTNGIDTSQLPENWKNFPDGSILRIEFHNFLTYEHTVCKPGENLNLILGHNGSGKSSIICGICLVFGGSPKSLGRSENIKEYIRHGCTEGSVEIILADKQNGPQVLALIIRKTKSHEYRLNKKATTQSEIKKLCKKYNIQIDNPCAFLAQDKVKSFSEQSPIELLYNTEKAASAELHENHLELIQKRIDSAQIEEKCESAIRAVKQIEGDIAKLEPRVENYRKKKEMQSKLRLLQQKSAIMNYKEAEKEYKKEIKNFSAISKKIENFEGEIEKCRKIIEEFTNNADVERKRIVQKKQECRKICEKLDAKMDSKFIENRLNEARRKLESKRKLQAQNESEKLQIEANIESLKRKIEEADKDLQGYQDFVKKLKSEEERLYQESMNMRKVEDAIQKKHYTIKTLTDKQNEVVKQKNESINLRFRMMERRNPDAAKAWKFYTMNKSLFNGPIYLPFMDLSLSCAEAAVWLEQTVGSRDFFMFVCTNKDDERRINSPSKGWRINSAVVRPENVHPNEINPTFPDELKQIGFAQFVSNFVQAPDTLKQYLCNVYQLHRIPVGGGVIDQNIDAIIKYMLETRYRLFFGSKLRYHVSISQYSQEIFTSQSYLPDAVIFNNPCFLEKRASNAPTADYSKEIDELKTAATNESRAVHEKKVEIQKARDQLKNEQSIWRTRKQAHSIAKNNLENEAERLASLERNRVDIEEAEKEFQREERNARQGAREMIKECVQLQKNYLKLSEEMAKLLIFEQHWLHKKSLQKEELERLNENSSGLRAQKRDAEERVKMQLELKKDASKELLNTCGLSHFETHSMDATEKKIYKNLNSLFEKENITSDLDELERQIHAEKTRLKMAQNSDSGSEEDERTMEQLKTQLVDENSKKEKLLETRQNLREKLTQEIDEWREKVERMITEINQKYREYFEKMGCLGEISLDVPENPLEIANYGIMIRVCFRAGEKLKRLDQKVQSGGERSVSTMLYLLALQHLCPVPFRCVDEINQGMDPTNERKVFDIMVGMWSDESPLSKTQYFLLTPKLLHGLAMNERVTVQIVHSVVQPAFSDWNTPMLLEATIAKA